MPLPKTTIRVLPNPWGFIHHELGPQGRCHEDAGGRGSTPRYIGAEPCPDKTRKLTDYESQPNETRLDVWTSVFRFPSLDSTLLGPAPGFEKGIELPKTPYYLDRLRDGDLIPADERSGEHGARFANLAEAKAAGVAAFEAHYDVGSFAEVCPELADSPKADTDAQPMTSAPTAPTTLAEARPAPPDAETAAETPAAKSARSSRASGADK
jgi:hypothetical protein